MALEAPLRLEGLRPHPLARQRLAAFLAALAGHAVVIYALVREPPEPMAGGGGHLLAAVNVTVVDSAVLQSRDDHKAPPAPASTNAVDAREGAPESTPPRPKRIEQKEEAAGEKTPLNEKVPDKPVPDEAAAVVLPKEAPRQEPDKERKEASEAADAVGGASAQGKALGAPTQKTEAGASPGVVRSYARLVQQALARRKPKATGRGTVKVRLQISPTGELAWVRIHKSSGNRRLDDIALAEVRRTKLPAPPPGLTDDQRLFDFPYYFH